MGRTPGLIVWAAKDACYDVSWQCFVYEVYPAIGILDKVGTVLRVGSAVCTS